MTDITAAKVFARTAAAAAAALANDEINALAARLESARTGLAARMAETDAAIDAIPEGLLDLGPLRLVKAPGGDASALAYLQSEIDGGGIPYLGPGLYPIDALRSLRLRDGQIVIAHPAAVLAAIPHGEDESFVVLADGVRDVTWIGGMVLGERELHRYPVYSPSQLRSTHEWNHGFRVRRCNRVRVSGLQVAMCGGDGLSVGGDDITLDRITSLRNRRQGLTIGGSARMRVLDSTFSHTGKLTLADGTVQLGAQLGPNAGIDVEPDTAPVTGLLIERCVASNNQKPGILFYAGSTKAVNLEATVRDCEARGNSNQIEAQAENGSSIALTIVGNTLQRRANSGVGIKLYPGAVTATIGAASATGADRNVLIGPTEPGRADFTRQGTGTNTTSDIQKGAGAIANVLWNDYR